MTRRVHSSKGHNRRCTNTALYLPTHAMMKYRVENLSPAMGREIDSRNRVWNRVAELHRLAGLYGNPMPTWFQAPKTGLKGTVA